MSTASGITIEVNALAKRFNREWIFRKLNFTFLPRRTYAVTGPNGSGKSTLLQVLWGQTPPSQGTLVYKEPDVEIPVEEIFPRLAVATPYMDLIDEFTLEEQVNFHFKLRKVRGSLNTDAVINRMNLPAAKNKQIGNFSSGMRQRVKLGLAFCTEADLVFLDEPGTNLDKTAFQWYLDELQKVQSSALVIIASNDPAEYVTAHESLNILDFK
jgi:ABC-type multidrug transport system ATPase subunit